jgi:hypothetical protein
MRRVEYATEDTVSSVMASSLPGPAKDLLAQVLRTGAMPNGQKPSGNARQPDNGQPAGKPNPP